MDLNATCYRYEIIGPRSTAGLTRQKNRVEDDENFTAKEKQLKQDMLTTLKSDWLESLEAMTEAKRAGLQRQQKQGEMKLISYSATQIRREQLKNLLRREQQMYETELAAIDKAFYIKRT